MQSFPLCFVRYVKMEIEGLQLDVSFQKSQLVSWFVLVICVVEDLMVRSTRM